MKVVLYHGGNDVIITPEIREPNRTLDFGKGFYLTSSQNQAERWVKTHLSINGIGYVNSYYFDLEAVPVDIKTKIFNKADEEWVDFVLANRLIDGYIHDYDIVVGPVANDRVYTQFSLFEGGIISKDTLISELKTYNLVDQYLFHTERSLDCIEYIDNYMVKL